MGGGALPVAFNKKDKKEECLVSLVLAEEEGRSD